MAEMDGEFTTEAKAVWGAIPSLVKDKILQNIWCSQCKSVATISGFTGQIVDGNLVLKGQCTKCGHAVARLIEGE